MRPAEQTHRRLRLAQVLPAGLEIRSGVATVIVELSRHLLQRGHHVELWSLRAFAPEDRTLLERTLRDLSIPMVAMHPRKGSAHSWLGRRPVDVVHLHSAFSPANAFLAARLAQPFVVTPHGGLSGASMRRSRIRKEIYGRSVERAVLRRASARVALTPAEARRINSLMGRPADVEIIPNGVSSPPDGVDGTAFRVQLGLRPDDLLLLFVGRLDVFHKGLDRLVQAVAESPGWHAALVGSDVEGGAKTVARLARKHRVESRLHLVGPRDGFALDEVFAAARLFLLPSRWEGLSMSLLEALAHGLPALVTPEVDETIGLVRAGAGWAAPPSDLGRSLAALSQLSDRAWIDAGLAARRHAAQYAWTESARRYEEVYAGCLSRSSGEGMRPPLRRTIGPRGARGQHPPGAAAT